MYFDQFLAWFGASLISGTFTDLWEDLKDTNPNLPLQWTSAPAFSSTDIDANINPLKISGVFNKSARWTVAFKQHAGDSAVQFSGSGETLSVVWYGFSSGGQALPAGWYDVTVSAKGLAVPFIGSCWLGRALDLTMKNRLLIDDFRDGNLVPFIGATWQNYLDSYEGKSGKSTVPLFAVQGSDTAAFLRWSFLLNGSSNLGYNAYAALEWNCQMPMGGNLNLTGLDTVVVVGKSLSSLPFSVQLITSDITDYNYFEDSVTFTPQWQEYRLSIKNFKRRFNGGNTTPSMAMVTALRFQIQNKDGFANEIQLKKMLFSGNLGMLYQSPPPYIPKVIPVKHFIDRGPGHQAIRIEITVNGCTRFHVPRIYQPGSIEIVDVKGNMIGKLPIISEKTLWDGLDIGKRRVRAGTYFALISGPGGANRFTATIIVQD
jgi:hypothetical protein